MAALFALKQFQSLRPCDEEGEELLKGIPNGTVCKIELTRPRNPRFHRLFFALVNFVYRNTDAYPSAEVLREIITIGIGHVETIVSPTDGVILRAKSISFAKMDEDQFRVFWNRAVDYVVAHVLPADRRDLEREVFSMVGIDLEMAR